MKVVVCGSRGWSDEEAIRERLSELPTWAEVIHGAAKGADQMAADAAKSYGLTETAFYPDWATHGRRAGYLRNLVMLDARPHLVIAFWDGESRGTSHTIAEARRRGIPVEVITT